MTNINITQDLATRDISHQPFGSACYAPFTNLYFDQGGTVRTCCWSENYNIGDVRTESIDEIWHGVRLARLRHALKFNHFGLGCGLCAEQLNRGWVGTTNMRKFDRYKTANDHPEWPTRIELSISNSCNLQCIMCNGEFSSAIRTHREKKSARPKVYPQNFSDQLMKYVPHLEILKFLGGEPFLISEYREMWEKMISEGIDTLCHVTTNGTIFTKNIENVLMKLRFAFAVSLDAATKELAEKIRVGLDYDEQLENIAKIKRYTTIKGTNLTLVYCFMRQNWHELGKFCELCEKLDCDGYVNTVNFPPDFGVYNLSGKELQKIRQEMEAEIPRLEKTLKRTRNVWFGELARIRSVCDNLHE